MLHFIFGDLVNLEVHYRDSKACAGYLEYQKAKVRWFLSIDSSHLPGDQIQSGKMTYRSMNIEAMSLNFQMGQ